MTKTIREPRIAWSKQGLQTAQQGKVIVPLVCQAMPASAIKAGTKWLGTAYYLMLLNPGIGVLSSMARCWRSKMCLRDPCSEGFPCAAT
eukprot:6491206-Amphidinium_carterae.1